MLSSGRKFAGSGFGVWPRRGTIIAALAALVVLLPIEASDAGRLQESLKSSSKQGKSSKQVSSPKSSALAKRAASRKPHTVKLAALGPAALNVPALKPVA